MGRPPGRQPQACSAPSSATRERAREGGRGKGSSALLAWEQHGPSFHPMGETMQTGPHPLPTKTSFRNCLCQSLSKGIPEVGGTVPMRSALGGHRCWPRGGSSCLRCCSLPWFPPGGSGHQFPLSRNQTEPPALLSGVGRKGAGTTALCPVQLPGLSVSLGASSLFPELPPEEPGPQEAAAGLRSQSSVGQRPESGLRPGVTSTAGPGSTSEVTSEGARPLLLSASHSAPWAPVYLGLWSLWCPAAPRATCPPLSWSCGRRSPTLSANVSPGLSSRHP